MYFTIIEFCSNVDVNVMLPQKIYNNSSMYITMYFLQLGSIFFVNRTRKNIKFIDEDEGLITELQASPKDELVMKR